MSSSNTRTRQRATTTTTKSRRGGTPTNSTPSSTNNHDNRASTSPSASTTPNPTSNGENGREKPDRTLQRSLERRQSVDKEKLQRTNSNTSSVTESNHRRDREKPERQDGQLKPDVYCICRQPNDGEAMICCEKCEEWFHFRCIGLSVNEASKIQIYMCDECKRKEEALKTREDRKRKRKEAVIEERRDREKPVERPAKRRDRKAETTKIVENEDVLAGDGTGRWLKETDYVSSSSDSESDDNIYLSDEDMGDDDCEDDSVDDEEEYRSYLYEHSFGHPFITDRTLPHMETIDGPAVLPTDGWKRPHQLGSFTPTFINFRYSNLLHAVRSMLSHPFLSSELAIPFMSTVRLLHKQYLEIQSSYIQLECRRQESFAAEEYAYQRTVLEDDGKNSYIERQVRPIHFRFVRDSQKVVHLSSEYQWQVDHFHMAVPKQAKNERAAVLTEKVELQTLFCHGCNGSIPVEEYSSHLDSCALQPHTTPDERLPIISPYVLPPRFSCHPSLTNSSPILSNSPFEDFDPLSSIATTPSNILHPENQSQSRLNNTTTVPTVATTATAALVPAHISTAPKNPINTQLPAIPLTQNTNANLNISDHPSFALPHLEDPSMPAMAAVNAIPSSPYLPIRALPPVEECMPIHATVTNFAAGNLATTPVHQNHSNISVTPTIPISVQKKSQVPTHSLSSLNVFPTWLASSAYLFSSKLRQEYRGIPSQYCCKPLLVSTSTTTGSEVNPKEMELNQSSTDKNSHGKYAFCTLKRDECATHRDWEVESLESIDREKRQIDARLLQLYHSIENLHIMCSSVVGEPINQAAQRFEVMRKAKLLGCATPMELSELHALEMRELELQYFDEKQLPLESSGFSMDLSNDHANGNADNTNAVALSQHRTGSGGESDNDSHGHSQSSRRHRSDESRRRDRDRDRDRQRIKERATKQKQRDRDRLKQREKEKEKEAREREKEKSREKERKKEKVRKKEKERKREKRDKKKDRKFSDSEASSA